MSFLSARKKAVLKWGYDRLWHRWPLLLFPLVQNFKKENHYFPNFVRPRTLNEKILYRMLFDRREFLPMFAGKLESRGFVAKRLGNEDTIIPVIGTIHNVDDVAKINFPARFVMKSNRGSEMIYLHTEDAPPDINHLQELCRTWLATDYAKYKREWVYWRVKQVVIVEELLTDDQGNIPTDYKIFCYDGIPRFIKTDTGRYEDHTSDIFDCEWALIPGHSETKSSETPPPRPPNLQQLLEIAKALSKDVDFVRVDLYDTGSAIKFGELTTTPARAAYTFKPHSLDHLFGKPWNLKTKRRPQDPQLLSPEAMLRRPSNGDSSLLVGVTSPLAEHSTAVSPAHP